MPHYNDLLHPFDDDDDESPANHLGNPSSTQRKARYYRLPGLPYKVRFKTKTTPSS